MKQKNKIEYSATSLGIIIDRVKNGEIRIPPFQRTFDWSGKDMARFFNSIVNGEPFGSIMLWNDNSGSIEIKQTNIYFNKLSGKEKKENSKTYLIDGQQRITSFIMLYLLHNNDKYNAKYLTKAESIYFDIKEKKFYSGKKREGFSILAHNFFVEEFRQLRKIISSDVNIDKICEEIRTSDAYTITEVKDDLFDEIKDVFTKFNDISLGKTEVFSSSFDEVIRIFTLINTKGKRLSPFNIVHAAYIASSYDLDTQFAKIINKYKVGGWEFKKSQLLLLGYSAMEQTISNGEILKSSQKKGGPGSEKIEYFNEKFEKHLEIVVDILKKQVFIPSLVFLPSNNIMNILIRIVSQIELDEKKYRIIRRWIKLAIINERYVSGSEGIKQTGYSYDVNSLMDALESDCHIDKLKKRPKWIASTEFDSKTIKEENYGSGSATYKYIISMIIKNIPSIVTGAFVEKENYSKANDLNIHHLFPKGNSNFKEYEFINSIANLTPLEKEKNLKISSNDPNKYIIDLIDKNKITIGNLSNALIDIKELCDIEKFINSRSIKIAKMLNEK